MLVKLENKVTYDAQLNAVLFEDKATALRMAQIIITQCVLLEGDADNLADDGEPEDGGGNVNPMWRGRKRGEHAEDKS